MNFNGNGKMNRVAGFTLVEMLISTAVFGILMTAMYSIFITTQRGTYTQEDVVDLQQNMRVAMDAILRDIRMTGFMVPNGDQDPPLVSVATGNTLSLVVQSVSHVYGVVDEDVKIPTGTVATAEIDFTVATATQADMFKPVLPLDPLDPLIVHIFRPQTRRQPYDADLTVADSDPGDATASPPVLPTVTIKGFVTTDERQFKKDDLIAFAAAGPPGATATITWARNGTNLERNGVVVASDIGALNFRYLRKTLAETATPGTTDAALREIMGVRVVLTASSQQVDGVTRSRQMTGIARLRN